jgi:hypothetical protein
MRFISTRIHGVLDFVMGLLLLTAPYALGFADGTAAQYVPQALGAAMLGAALLTDYELGLIRVIPMSVHLTLDLASGALLAASPWLFGFADRLHWPHLILGLLEVGAALTTRRVPDATTDLQDSSATRRSF